MLSALVPDRTTGLSVCPHKYRAEERMEESKAAAYYDELARKGEGAARFKQGLGFSASASTTTPSVDSKPSFYSSFVRASTPGKVSDVPETQPEKSRDHAQVDASRSKLIRKPPVGDKDPGPSRTRDRDRHRSRSRERRDRRDEKEEKLSRRSIRSRRYSYELHGRRRRSSRGGDRDYQNHRHRDRWSRSRSPRRSPRSRSRSVRDLSWDKDADTGQSNKAGIDYSRLFDGYSQMTPAEKVKAKMKFQLSQTVEKDMAKGVNTGWERFDFNKDAPLDDEEEEIEVAEDGASLVKNMGKSFRFTAVEAKREDEIRAAHDQAMFGAPAALPVLSEEEFCEQNDTKEVANNSLLSDKVVAMQQGSWRDRVWRQEGSRN